ncbi:MAG: 3-dehydroquinate synthase [Pelagibacteraceae bacterium]|nr:3-dehydroquinate synthase [Pelagibacteraceae bacterium]|tara:strand:+ start:17709 stop:18782 length:1074 start_codon:yes stop_codon:yes gene_type:complete
MSKIIKSKFKNKSYNIEIENNSVIKKLTKIIKDNNNNKVHIIIDKKVKYLIKNFKNYSNVNIILTNAGENIKSFNFYKKISNDIITYGIDRKSLLIGIGGGTIGDLSGFIAATILRGINFILIPTTLLSQVDSSVGGKNGINTIHGKNLIGTFYQPTKVIIDPAILNTLSNRELKSGYAEILKHALINDAKFFYWLEKYYKKILMLNKTTMEEAIYKSIKIKNKYILTDPEEKLVSENSRSMLNFGHTFGHALETFYKYKKKLTHGEAISIGMFMESKLSYSIGKLSKTDLNKIKNHLLNCGLPIKDKNSHSSIFFNILLKDKKNYGKNINLVLLKKIGKSYFKRNLNIKIIKQNII